MTEGVMVAIIGATAVVGGAIITARATIHAARKKESPQIPAKSEPIEFPPEDETVTTPFDLPLEEQEFGTENYVEALGCDLLRTRPATDVIIRRLKKGGN